MATQSVDPSGEPESTWVLDGNRFTVISSGPALLTALLDLINGARDSVKLFYYIFAEDDSGRAVLDALIEACMRGATVTLMIDAFGSSATRDAFFEPLREAGARFAWFGAGWTTRYLIRNHQKLALADDSRLLIGGFNVSDAYFGQPSDNCWHDMGLFAEGTVTAPMVRWYALLWQWTSGKRRSYRRLRSIIRAWRPGVSQFQWLIGGPTNRLSPWARVVRSDLDMARRVDMVAAYFSPGQRMLRRLWSVAQRASGAEDGVRLILASKSDNGATIAAARLLYGPLVRRGVKIFEYAPCRLHMKLIVIDDAVYIGSANFDMRSLFLNLELMLRIEDSGFADHMRQFINEREQSSRPITATVLEQRKRPWRLIKGWISYLLVGVLDYTVTRKLNFDNDLPVDQM